ncbi:MAG: hypothetical protein ACXWJM_09975, partial [Ramlibacter sp.]
MIIRVSHPRAPSRRKSAFATIGFTSGEGVQAINVLPNVFDKIAVQGLFAQAAQFYNTTVPAYVVQTATQAKNKAFKYLLQGVRDEIHLLNQEPNTIDLEIYYLMWKDSPIQGTLVDPKQSWTNGLNDQSGAGVINANTIPYQVPTQSKAFNIQF